MLILSFNHDHPIAIINIG